MNPGARAEIGRGMAIGAGWLILLRLADRGIGLVSLAILARLLLPEDFGLVALAASFIALIGMWGQIGVEVALIQNQHATRRHYDVAWTINLATTLVVSALIVLLAGRAASFFSEPRVAPIAYWLALANAIRAFENIGVVDFRKHLEFHKEFRYLFMTRVASTAATVLAAIYWREYRALLAGAILQSLVRVGLSYVMSPYRPRFALAGAGQIMHFSKWMLVQNIIYALNEKVASLVIGRFAQAGTLAQYSVAYEISNLATTELAAPIRRALLPGFSKMSGDLDGLREGFIRSVGVIALVGLPVPIGIALTAPMVVALLLGPNWSAAVPLIQILALHGVLRTVGTSSGVVYLALGRPRLTAILSGARLAVLVPLLIALTGASGATGAAWAMVLTSALMWIVDVVLVLRVLAFPAKSLLAALWRPIVAALIMMVAVYAFKAGIAVPATVVASTLQLITIVALGAGVYLLAALVLWRACSCPPGAESAIFETLMRMIRSRAHEASGAATTGTRRGS